MDRIVYILLIIFLVLIVFWLNNFHNINTIPLNSFEIKNMEIFIGNNTYNTTIYVAATPKEQEQGYMNVSISNYSCKYKCGMLFPFTNMSYVCFWMKNTEFPIKQIWLKQINKTKNYTIYSIVKIANALPYNTTPICAYGSAVLEIPSQYNINGLNVSKISNKTIFKIN